MKHNETMKEADAVAIRLKDPTHLEAHRAEFLQPLEDILVIVEKAVTQKALETDAQCAKDPSLRAKLFPREESFLVRGKKPVGKGGLRRIWPWTKGDYWAPRTGRTIPSHLIDGKGRKTRNLCIWGRWENERAFVLHTVYAGKPAPREIHDPNILPEDISRAIAFWKTHAIIVERP